MNPRLLKVLISVLLVIILAGAGTLYFILNNTSAAGDELTIDEMVKHSYVTEEMRTDLTDGNYVLIQFQFITDSKNAMEEIEKREFQIKNVFIKQSVNLTTNDFKENLEALEDNMKTAMNERMVEGKIVDVYITSKIIQ